jgi:hypothetical protein
MHRVHVPQKVARHCRYIGAEPTLLTYPLVCFNVSRQLPYLCHSVRTVWTLFRLHKSLMQRGNVTRQVVRDRGCKWTVRALVVPAALMYRLEVNDKVARVRAGIGAVITLGISLFFMCQLDVLGKVLRSGKGRVTMWALFVPEPVYIIHMSSHVPNQLQCVVTVWTLDLFSLLVHIVHMVSPLSFVSSAKCAELANPTNFVVKVPSHNVFIKTVGAFGRVTAHVANVVFDLQMNPLGVGIQQCLR